jgi:hypothetical protein
MIDASGVTVARQNSDRRIAGLDKYAKTPSAPAATSTFDSHPAAWTALRDVSATLFRCFNERDAYQRTFGLRRQTRLPGLTIS